MKLRYAFLLAPAALALTAAAPKHEAPGHASGGHEKAVQQTAAYERPSARPAPAPAHGKPHWAYAGESGPESWGDLSEEFKLCKAGHMQSPIDLGGVDIEGKIAVRAAYQPGPLTLLNNGHTVQAVIAPGSTMTSGIARYKLLQVHFHTPSEEVLYGLPYPMVAHFVHVDHAGNLAVLGVLFEEGAHNPELEKLVRAAPAEESEATVIKGVTFDPSRLLPQNLAVYRYEGSLTTPPCTEGVRWHVARHRVTASAAQIAALHGIMGDNARPIQPLHGRLLVAGAD